MLTLFAPNRFIKDFVSDKFAERISELVRELEPERSMDVVLEIGAGTASLSRVGLGESVSRGGYPGASKEPAGPSAESRALSAQRAVPMTGHSPPV